MTSCAPAAPDPSAINEWPSLVRKTLEHETARRHPLECAAHRRPDPAFEVHVFPGQDTRKERDILRPSQLWQPMHSYLEQT